MKYLFNFYLFFQCILFKLITIACLKTNFQCTTNTLSTSLNTDSSNNEYLLSSENYLTSKTLKLDCKNDLIFIVWSHYGHQNQQPNNKINRNSCNFSTNDCIVNVDYVANECNGLNSCQISLDTQYLHSCKAYSDYIFILYDCIDASKTVNVCNDVDIDANNEIYIQTPNYPNEYVNNLKCNCMLESETGNQVKIQLLEFDLDSLFDSEIKLFLNNIIDTSLITSSNNKCNKDYLSINDFKLCGTISSYNNFYANLNGNQISLKFTSDDALTRRGVWIKLKAFKHQAKCPENFFLIEDKCVRIYDTPSTWFESKQFCSSLGFELLKIENFEIDKQLNRMLDDSVKFWIGLKQLNGTNWFDENNQVIQVDTDQRLWWPWFQFDNLLNNQGSCVGKYKHGMFLEDCYQRLKFACQYSLKMSSVEPLNLKCGKSIHKSKLHRKYYNNNNEMIKNTTNKIDNNIINDYKNYILISQQKANNEMNSLQDNKITKQQITNNGGNIIIIPDAVTKMPINTLFPTLTTTTTAMIFSNNNNNTTTLVERVLIANRFYPDSTLFIAIISSIIILIAFVNVVVIMILCRRRKSTIIKQTQHKQESQLDYNHFHNTHHTQLNKQHQQQQQQFPTPITNQISSSLNCDHISYATTTESTDFLTFNYNNRSNSIKQQFFTLNKCNNINNPSSSSSSMIDKSDIIMINNSNSGNSNRSNLNNDPSVHVYETISVSAMYGRHNPGLSDEFQQQQKLAEPEFYYHSGRNNSGGNNFIIFPNNEDIDELCPNLLNNDSFNGSRQLTTIPKSAFDTNNSFNKSFRNQNNFKIFDKSYQIDNFNNNSKNNDEILNFNNNNNNKNSNNKITNNNKNTFLNDFQIDNKKPQQILFINNFNNQNNKLLNDDVRPSNNNGLFNFTTSKSIGFSTEAVV